MEGKLIKLELSEGYRLDDLNGNYIASTLNGKNKLSLKNCQEIENGYDLDELAMGYDLYENINFVGQMRAFKAGFQKALEILGDKKFSEFNLRIGCSSLLNLEKEEGELSEVFTEKQYRHIDNYIQSLQQTEWDVEICCYVANANDDLDSFNSPLITNTGIPKLDANGCLILKRK